MEVAEPPWRADKEVYLLARTIYKEIGESVQIVTGHYANESPGELEQALGVLVNKKAGYVERVPDGRANEVVFRFSKAFLDYVGGAADTQIVTHPFQPIESWGRGGSEFYPVYEMFRNDMIDREFDFGDLESFLDTNGVNYRRARLIVANLLSKGHISMLKRDGGTTYKFTPEALDIDLHKEPDDMDAYDEAF